MSALIAWLFIAFGGGLTFAIMASDRVWSFGVELGALGVVAASIGMVRLIGGGKSSLSDSPPPEPHQANDLLVNLVVALGSWIAWLAIVYFAVAGVYPAHAFVAGASITLGFMGCVVLTYRVTEQLGIGAQQPELPLIRRGGLWLFFIGALLNLPMLGNFALLDPWETHYGEVAREILARDDWISLWWAQDGWFWSKPVLGFWLQSLSFKVFGVAYLPDQMLAGLLQGHTPQPEWAARLPLFVMTQLSVYVLYRACVRPFGRRAAFLGSLVLMTCPYWFILARQTMADMPYVAPMTAAMGFLMLGLQTQPDDKATNYSFKLGRRHLSVSAYHLLMVVVVAVVLPQVIYLLTRNITLHLGDPFGFRLHLDELQRGSGGGNCGLPGNKSCAAAKVKIAWGQPGFAALLWAALTGLWLFFNRRERRTQRLYFLAGWFCTALAILGKGAPGLVIPVASALVYLVVTARFRDLLRLELLGFLLLTLVVAMPWYVQMTMRHGQGFIDRLIFHDMVKRAFKHVHDTNKGDDTSFRYYIWQLGYGLFPWTGLTAGGLLWWARREQRPTDQSSDTSLFLLIWWLVTFGMFSITGTKFHHYILPLVPPTAMLVGVLLARYVPTKLPSTWRQTATYYGVMVCGTGALYFAILSCFPGSLIGNTWDGELAPRKLFVAIPLMLVTLGVMAVVMWRTRASLGDPVGVLSALASERRRYLNGVLSVLALVAAAGVILAGRDLFTSLPGDREGPLRILHLVTYNYARPWPAELDFRPALLAFTILSGGACLLMTIHSIRQHSGVILCAGAFWWAAWVMDVYLVKIAPHWSQRETMAEYVRQRSGPEELLVAYQMNWKGENFYTGNRMATYVSSGEKFKKWIKKQRRKGKDTLFFTTEHSRIGSLKRELGKPKNFELLTTKADNNKFVLAKVIFDELPTNSAEVKKSTASDKKSSGRNKKKKSDKKNADKKNTASDHKKSSDKKTKTSKK